MPKIYSLLLISAAAVILFVSFVFTDTKDETKNQTVAMLSYFQSKKIEHYQMEFEAKVSVLKKELILKKKLFSEELTKENQQVDIYLLEKISDDIKYLSQTIEQMWIDSELNIRNSMTHEQYENFKAGRYVLKKQKSKK